MPHVTSSFQALHCDTVCRIHTIRRLTRSQQLIAITMVYDWEDKQETCYRLYVDEKKSLDDVMKFFREEGTSEHYCVVTPFGRP